MSISSFPWDCSWVHAFSKSGKAVTIGLLHTYFRKVYHKIPDSGRIGLIRPLNLKYFLFKFVTIDSQVPALKSTGFFV
jgi:hypothetical protein